MKRKTILSAITGAALLLLAASCANDDTAQDNKNPEPGTEGLTAFIIEDNNPPAKGTATRTTAEYDGSGLNFYWTTGDRLWVNKATSGTPDLLQDKRNNIGEKLVNSTVTGGVQRAAMASFWFEGNFTANQYKVRYTGQSGMGDRVTIAASQTQTVPNDASHLAINGDCGVATAHRLSNNRYTFMLDHKAAYITFMPYTNQGVVAGAKIQKIRVFTGNPSDALAGTFDFDDNGTFSNPVGTSNSVELDVTGGSWNGGFSIPSTSTYATNAATMVVNPGTYSNVSIEYTLYDPVTQAIGTITKTYPSITFTAGRNKRVKTDLQVTVYPHNTYYMWDAQQQYWYGHESSQPKPENPSAPSDNSWPQSKATDPDRWYNDVPGYNDYTGAAPAVLPSHIAAGCPNVNELCWYVENGDPHWDIELWATMGHLYAGGMWFKKKGNISGYSVTQAPDGIDYTRSTNTALYSNNTITPGRPSNLNNYFYLPAFGIYNNGRLGGVGNSGIYWSSTPNSMYLAYDLILGSDRVSIGYNSRDTGVRLWNKNNEDQYRPDGL